MKNTTINCTTFRKQENSIKKIKDEINQAPNIQTKKILARKLHNEVQVLLNCKHYEASNSDCQSCRLSANLHQQVIALIEKASQFF